MAKKTRTKPRGFAAMDPAKRLAAASKGGKSVHAKGTAHEWGRDEAILAGRKGGRVTKDRREAKAEKKP